MWSSGTLTILDSVKDHCYQNMPCLFACALDMPCAKKKQTKKHRQFLVMPSTGLRFLFRGML